MPGSRRRRLRCDSYLVQPPGDGIDYFPIRCLAVAAAKMANVVEAKAALQAMRGDESRADPDEIEAALKALS